MLLASGIVHLMVALLGKNIFKQELLKLTEEKEITLIISSHSLRELEDICDSYCMLDKGRIISESSSSLQEL